MKYFIFLFIILLCQYSIAQRENLKLNVGCVYHNSFNSGKKIQNSTMPNLESSLSYNIYNAKHIGIEINAGVITHNFKLKDIKNNNSYTYFRAEPFLSLSTIYCINKENNNFFIYGIFGNIRAGCLNKCRFNSSWQFGVISKTIKNINIYAKFSKFFYYKIPYDNFLLFNFTNNYYPLGNERWSISVGTSFSIGKPKHKPLKS